MYRRPNAPYGVTFTRYTCAAFSASFAASTAYPAGSHSKMNSDCPGSTIIPELDRLMICVWYASTPRMIWLVSTRGLSRDCSSSPR